MPVPLPQLSYLPVSRMPQAPGEIPTLKDIANADILEQNVRESHANRTNTYEDLAKTIIYKTKVVAASAGGEVAPIWLGQAIANALLPIANEMRAMRAAIEGEFQIAKADIQSVKADIQTMKADIQTVKADVQTVKADIRIMKADIEVLKEESTKTRRLTAQLYNAKSGSGVESTYEVVPFPSGQDPTTPPYNLPHLSSVEALNGLTDRQLDLYLRNYYPDLRRVIRNRDERIDLIASAIGMRDVDPLH